jgi:hypothetical protein
MEDLFLFFIYFSLIKKLQNHPRKSQFLFLDPRKSHFWMVLLHLFLHHHFEK